MRGLVLGEDGDLVVEVVLDHVHPCLREPFDDLLEGLLVGLGVLEFLLDLGHGEEAALATPGPQALEQLVAHATLHFARSFSNSTRRVESGA